MINRAQDIANTKLEIQNGLYEIETYINSQKPFNADISFIAELFIEELLNEIFKNQGYNFKNLNYKKANYPAIDIADEENRISYQVTVTNNESNLTKKVRHTLESFFERGLDKKYNELYIVVASGIPDKNKILKVPSISIGGKPIAIPITLFNSKNIIDLSDFNTIIAGNAGIQARIKDVIYKIPKRPIQKRYSFKINHQYIKRSYSRHNNQIKGFKDFLDKEKRLVLLGVGGLGKTTELQFLAHRISQEQSNFCFKVNLIDYANSLKELLNAHCKNWQNVPDFYNSYFILDGLDEVNGEKIRQIANEIKLFALENPSSKILVSCRNNFNPFDIYYKEEDESKDDKFKVCFLKEVSENDITDYVNTESKTPELLLLELNKTQFIDLVKNPYYLVNIVEIFNSQNLIPQNSSEFFDKLVEQRIQTELSKNSQFKMNVNMFEMRTGLRLLAFTMQFAGKFQIDDSDFSQLIRNNETRNAIKRLFFNEDENNWRFEHNNLQEFLAAQFLSEQNWVTIKKVIIQKLKKLKPNWLNAFSFLVNLIPPEHNLFSYILENDIESLVKVEPDKIDNETRNKVFIQIFNKHKAEGTIVWNLPYTNKNLYTFGKLEDNEYLINYLLSEIQNPNSTIQIVANAVHLLGELKKSSILTVEIKTQFLRLLKVEEFHKYAISRKILESFSKWKQFGIELKNQLIKIENLYNKEAPLTTYCYYFIDGQFKDIAANFVHKLVNAFDGHRTALGEYALFQLVEQMSHSELTKLISLVTPTNHNGRYRHWSEKFYETINKQAIKTYHSNSKISDVITEFIYASFLYHDERFGNAFKSFFIELDIVFESFKKCFIDDLISEKTRRREFFIVPAQIGNSQCFNWVVKYYISKPFSDEMMWNFLIALNIVQNFEGRSYFMQQIRTITNERFEPKPNPYDLFNKKKSELWFKAALDQKLALKFIQKGFNLFETEDLTRTEIIKKQYDREEKFKDAEIITGLEIISHYSDDNINKNEFTTRFSKNKYWEWVQIREHQRFIQNKEIPQANIDWIQDWCVKILPEIRFKGAITQKADGTYTYYDYTNYFVKFAIYINLKLSEEQLLPLTKLIGFSDFNRNINNQTTEFKLYDYLRNNLNLNTLKNQIIKNLKEGQLVKWVLNSHIDVVEKERWIDAKDSLIKYIVNPQIEKHESSRALRVYKSFNGEAKKLVPALETLTFKGENNYFDWELIDFMVTERNMECIQYLKTKINYDSENQLKFGIYLLIAEQQISFDIIRSNLKTNEKFTENEFLSKTVNQIPLNSFTSENLFNFLNDILKIYIIRDFGNGESFNNMLPILYDKMFELTTSSSLDEINVLEQIQTILDNSVNNETNKRARYRFYELEEKFKTHMDKGCQVSEAIKELKTLGITYDL